MIGRYQVLKHLATGGMAEVLLARAVGIEGFERHVVIKRIHVERAKDQQAVSMFLDEARLAASLHHANIVQVHDIGQHAGEYFFTMEYVHGEDLRRLLTELSTRKAIVPIEHVITIVSAAAAALHYAHEHRGPDRKPLDIVHRDVSPANILVGYDGTVKVVDFGIAKAALRSTETQSGTLKGKIAYMAPEQCLGQRVDRRSDVFALGIVLYELCCVRRLFKGSSDFLTMSSIVAGQIPSPKEHRPDLPDELEAIIMRALSLAPENRFQTAEEMRIALDQFAIRAGIRGSTTALADYITSIFGSRPEPWLVEDDEPEIELDADFDGDAAGLVAGPSHRVLTPPPGSLLARIRRKPAAPGGVPVVTAPSQNQTTVLESPIAPGSTEPSTQTPMAWSTPPPDSTPSARSRRSWWVVAAVVPLVIGGGVFAMTRGGDVGPATSAAQPLVTPEPPKQEAVPPKPEPVAPEPMPEPPKPEPLKEPDPVVVEPKTPPATVAVKKRPVKTPPKKPSPPKGGSASWDPTKLLPE